eukprot:scpid35002/ scgid22703/ 
MLRDAEALDFLPALSSSGTDVQSSESYAAVATKQKQLHTLQQQNSALLEQAQTAQSQLHRILAQIQAAEEYSLKHTQLSAASGMLHQLRLHAQDTINTLLPQMEELDGELKAMKVRKGPCHESFEPVLKKPQNRQTSISLRGFRGKPHS